VTSPEIFDKEMKYLIDNNYKVISMPEYIEHLNNNTLYLLSENIVIITFDDGYKSQYEEAFPILKKYNLSATFFVYADCVDKYPICMSSQDLLELSSSNMYIANHTLHHIFLPDYKDNIVRREIIENQKALDQILYPNKSIKVLAYPLGGVDDRIKNILIDIDYSAGFGVLTNVSGLSRDKYNLKRYLLGNDFELFKSIFTQK
jgi:peptidoglycan/xylan/chitin deacetylase (PgdA/CDA1 family)